MYVAVMHQTAIHGTVKLQSVWLLKVEVLVGEVLQKSLHSLS